LKVTYLSTHRSSCAIEPGSLSLVVGDLVRFVPAAGKPATAEPGPEEVPAGARRRPAGGGLVSTGLRGRVGARYLAVKDRSGNDNGFREPGLDLRLDGFALGGSPLDLEVDIRARRTYRTMPGGGSENEGRHRLYRSALSYRFPGGQEKLTVGRQFAPALAGLSLFDGVMYGYGGRRYGAGAFAGSQPDPEDLGFSSEIREYGGYFEVHSGPEVPRRWAFTTGFVGSYTQGTVNREFLYLQGHYFDSRFSIYGTQQIDYNRGWKVTEAKESTFAGTGTFVSVRTQAAERLNLFAGYDSRRNVRLYRDRITPVTEFDDSTRQGTWGGASLRLGQHCDAGGEARESRGGPSGAANSYSLNLGAERFTRAGLGFRLRGTHFSNLRSNGDLFALSSGVSLATRYHLELQGGRLDETNAFDPSLDRHLNWYGLDVDLALGRAWYLLLSIERNDGNLEKNDQAYAGLTVRF